MSGGREHMVNGEVGVVVERFGIRPTAAEGGVQ